MISIRIEPVNLDSVMKALTKIPGGIERAIPRAVRRSLRGGRQAAGRKIAQRYTIPAGKVTSTIRTSVSGFNGEMTSRGSRIPLERFKVNPKKRQNPPPPSGVFATVVRGQGGGIRRAFFQRSGGIYERTTAKRYPLRRLKSVAAPQMLGSPTVSAFITEHLQKRLEVEIIHEANAVIGGMA